MSKNLLRSLAALALCTGLMSGTALAQGKGHGSGGAANQSWRADRDGDNWNHRDWRGDRDRWTFGEDRRPSGWDRGKKTGWGNCDVPPGQAKKMGCRSGSRFFRFPIRRDRDRLRDRNRRDYDRYRNHDRR
jgi:hypothetical protein